MELNINERIAILFAIKARRKELMNMVKSRIEYLKSLDTDITEDRNISYWVNDINVCTRVMGKIWRY